jgi:hypothetical protein
MLYGIPPLRMVMLAKHAALNFPQTFKSTLAIMAVAYDRDDPVCRSKEQ